MIQRIKILLLAILLFFAPCTTVYAATQPVDAEGHTASDLENKWADIIAGSTNAVIYWQDNKIQAVYYSSKDIYYDDSSNVIQGGRYMTYKGGQGNGSQGNVKITDIYKIKGQVRIQDKMTNEVKGTLTQADLAKDDNPTETTPTNGSESNETTGILSGITNYIAKIWDVLTSIGNAIGNLAQTIIDGNKNILEQAFVPTDEQMAKIWPDPKEYNFVTPQIDMITIRLQSNKTPPKLTVHVPSSIKQMPSGTITILDLAPLEPYHQDILDVIAGFIQLGFAQGLIKNLPSIIQGAGLISTAEAHTDLIKEQTAYARARMDNFYKHHGGK